MFNSLRVRVTIILLSLAIGPILIAGLVLIQRSLAIERARAYNLQDQVTQTIGAEIEAYLQARVLDLSSLGNDLSSLSNPDRAQQLSFMLGMLTSGSDQDAYEELTLLDATGMEQVRLSRQEIIPSDQLADRSGLEEYLTPKSTRSTYYGPVYKDDKTGKTLLTLAIPLYEPRSVQLIGILVANIDLATISKLLSQAQVGEGQTIYVTDTLGNVIAHENRALDIKGLKIAIPESASTQRGLDGTNVVLGARKLQLETQILYVVAEQSTTQALQLAYTTILTIIFVVLGATFLAFTIGVLAVRQIIQPILGLVGSAERIASGELTHKAAVLRQDEIGILATAFNRMTDQLRNVFTNLERMVTERTSEVEAARLLSEKRAQNLQTIAEIARHISTEKDLEKLLLLVTRVVSERFNFYHVGIFLLDETRKYAVLRASNSTGGQAMLLRQHRLEVGKTGIVGYVTATGSPRIALDTGADSVYFNNPDLPDTRSEMALPLTTRGSIIGALDVQSDVPNAFTDADVSVLSLLADQIAVAIDNARLLEETQSSLAESQTLFNEYIAESWQKKTQTGILGYHQTLTSGKILTDTTISEIEIPNQAKSAILEVPIRVRDQVVGILNIRLLSEDAILTPGELRIIQAVAERLGLALDNARLFEETSSRASRERLVTEITSRIRGTNSPQDMIRTAVDELQRALGATRVEIVPQKPAPPPEI